MQILRSHIIWSCDFTRSNTAICSHFITIKPDRCKISLTCGSLGIWCPVNIKDKNIVYYEVSLASLVMIGSYQSKLIRTAQNSWRLTCSIGLIIFHFFISYLLLKPEHTFIIIMETTATGVQSTFPRGTTGCWNYDVF